MFITVKRHEREKQELIGASNRLTDAILKGSAQGLFLLDAKGKILPQVSASLATLFRRQEFANLTLEKLIAPLVSAKTLGAVRTFLARLLDAAAPDDAGRRAIRCRMSKSAWSIPTAPSMRPTTPSSSMRSIFPASRAPGWYSVTDITARVQQHARARGFAHACADPGRNTCAASCWRGGARFGAFLQRTDASMKAINERVEKAGARSRRVPQQARRDLGRGRSSPARCRRAQAHRTRGRCAADGRFLAGIAQPRRA